MKMCYRGFSLFIALFLLAACAPALEPPEVLDAEAKVESEKLQDRAVDLQIRRLQRVVDVWTRLKRANVSFCGKDVHGSLNVGILHAEMLPESLRGAYRRRTGHIRAPQFIHVVGGGPAAKAGIQVGDSVIQVNGDTLTKRDELSEWTDDTLYRPIQRGQMVQLVLNRPDVTTPITLSVTPTKACNYGIFVMSDDLINAYADGKRVSITAGMLRFLKNDDQLAWILAHELAHNVYGLNNMGFKGEYYADYVASYFTARAGYDPVEIIDFWERLGAEDPEGLRLEGREVHPSTTIRIMKLRRTAQEIADKKVVGTPLQPNTGLENFK
ncbi:MAG: M48 family metalloprotease [Magnetococcales bacterium]|nr:M48 family metalloprotease [Magnetococcales bacterium]